MDGFRTDHMGLSPDGLRLLVSDSTSRQVIEYSMVDQTLADGTEVKMGDRLRTFPSGETPHESNYTSRRQADLPRVDRPGLHPRRRHRRARRALRPADRPGQGRPLVPDRAQPRLQDPASAGTCGHELEEAGYPDMSSAVRPMAIAPRLALRLLPGLVLPRLRQVRHPGAGPQRHDRLHPRRRPRADDGPGARASSTSRTGCRPCRATTTSTTRPTTASRSTADGTTLCVAGTMDDYAALVDAGPPARPTLLRRDDHRPRLRQAVLDDRGTQRHLLDLAERERRGRGARHEHRRGAGLPARSATTRSGSGTATSGSGLIADW